MKCTASEQYGLFDCPCCLVDALKRCKTQNKEAYSKWGKQLKNENEPLYQMVKTELEKG